MVINRRRAIKAVGLLSGARLMHYAPANWAIGAAIDMESTESFQLNRVHLQAAQRARELAKHRGVNEISLLLPSGCEPNVMAVIDEFKRLTDIRVTIVSAPVDDINTRLLLSTASGSAVTDLALPATFGIPDLVEAGALAKLNDFAQRYEPQGFQAQSLYSAGDYYKGNLYGYQTDGDTYMMFYNRDMLDHPDWRKAYEDQYATQLNIPNTWSELDRQIRFFHRPEVGQFGAALFRAPTYILWEWWVRFHAKGLLPLQDNLEPQINSEAGVAALQELVATSQYLIPEARSAGLFDNWKIYAKGNVYANIGWGGTQKYLQGPKSKVKDKLAFGATPGGMVKETLLQTPYFNWGWNYTVTSSSNYKELAYLFALFATSPAISTISVRENGFFDPFRPEHYRDKTIKEVYSEDFLRAHEHSMSMSIPDFYLAGQGEYLQALRTYLVYVDQGKLKAQAALDTVANIWRRLHQKYGLNSQEEQWRYVKSRYPKQLLNT